MSQHSAGPDRAEGPILGHTRIWVGWSQAILEPVRDASCRRPAVFPQHRRDLAPAIESAQADLPAHHEADEQDERGVLGGQGALGLPAPAKLLVQALDHVGRAQRLPLTPGALEEGEEFLAPLLQAADDARAA